MTYPQFICVWYEKTCSSLSFRIIWSDGKARRKILLSKFSDVEVKKYHRAITRNKDLLDEVLKNIREKPGVILYTIPNNTLRDKLKRFCLESKIPCVTAVSKIVNEILDYLGVWADDGIGFRNKFDETYFDVANNIFTDFDNYTKNTLYFVKIVKIIEYNISYESIFTN